MGVVVAGRLIAGAVPTDVEHIELLHADDDALTPVARVSHSNRSSEFVVQVILPDEFSDAAAIVDHVREQLTYYLVDLDERDPWAYARYHCTTASNAYSKVRWVLREPSG